MAIEDSRNRDALLRNAAQGVYVRGKPGSLARLLGAVRNILPCLPHDSTDPDDPCTRKKLYRELDNFALEEDFDYVSGPADYP